MSLESKERELERKRERERAIESARARERDSKISLCPPFPALAVELHSSVASHARPTWAGLYVEYK
jgi:hypothetical protein